MTGLLAASSLLEIIQNSDCYAEELTNGSTGAERRDCGLINGRPVLRLLH